MVALEPFSTVNTLPICAVVDTPSTVAPPLGPSIVIPVRGEAIATMSWYVPAASWIVSPDAALDTAYEIVAQGLDWV